MGITRHDRALERHLIDMREHLPMGGPRFHSHTECLGLSLLHARLAPYPLYYLSSSQIWKIKNKRIKKSKIRCRSRDNNGLCVKVEPSAQQMWLSLENLLTPIQKILFEFISTLFQVLSDLYPRLAFGILLMTLVPQLNYVSQSEGDECHVLGLNKDVG